MSGLVSGYSGIIAPTNLVTNGAFRINQRGTFSTLTPVKVGDYVSDCWYVGANTNADYVEARNYSTEGLMQFTGYGKKGQRVEIQLKPRDNFGYGVIGDYNGSISPANSRWHYTTSWMTVLNTEGVDIQARFQGPYNWNDDLWHQDPLTLVKSGEIKQTTACINQSRGDTLTTGGFAFFILEEDGEFNVRFYHATCVTGAYKHPPNFVPVPYADDLARCQRYYQRINVQDHFGVYPQALIHYNGDSRVVHDYILPTQMATDASPVLIRHGESVSEYSVSSALGNSNNFSTKYPTFFGRVKGGRKVRFYLHRSSQDTSVTAMVASYTLELEIV